MKSTNILRNSSRERGFALIVTLSLMILLTVIAVGLLSLSSISLRSTSSNSAMTEARSNARLAVLLALGQLQLKTGPDTRVTASANILGSTQPSITGAWRSWEGSDHDSTGKPIIPNYGSKRVAGVADDQPVSSSGRFLGWLTSATAGTDPNIAAFPDISATAALGYTPLVSTGSVSDPASQVYIKPTLVNSSKGAVAWWTSGDNSKAMVNADRTAKPTDGVGWQKRVRSNGRADANTFGLETVNTLTPGTVIPSTGNLKLANPGADLKKIHDLTAFSRGLLTNTATGGWRRDLSLMSEKFSSLPSSGLPFFTLTPGRDQTYSKAQNGSTSGNPLIYPWAKYRSNGTGENYAQAPPICSWSALVDYTRQYTRLSSTGSSKTIMPPYFGILGDGAVRDTFQDQVRRLPQMARIQWIYSLGSRPSPTIPGKFNPGIILTPVLTLWNPYNVEISIDNFGIRMKETAPLSLELTVGSESLAKVSLGDMLKPLNLTDPTKPPEEGYWTFVMKVETGTPNNTITLPPGASRIFSTTDLIPAVNTAAADVKLKPGYRAGGGVLLTRIKKVGGLMFEVQADGTSKFGVAKISYDAKINEEGRDGVGVICDMIIANTPVSATRMVYDVNELGGQATVDQLYPPLTTSAKSIISAININSGGSGSIPSKPFATGIFANRMASPLTSPRDPNIRLTHLFSKGMLQANPLCFYAEVGYGDDANGSTTMKNTGVYHPINSPFDYAFQLVSDWTGFVMPNVEPLTNSTYIVTGLTPADGLTRCVMAELPTRPLQSLAELQHFDARNNNCMPPFQFNLIGNGSAHPLFGPDKIEVPISLAHKNNGMCNDDTYILNHLLFDDWFVSSIAPDLTNYSASSARSIDTVYQDHLSLTTPLPNRFYVTAPDAGSPNSATAVKAAMSNTKDTVTGKYSFETIASKLVVDGMFNINSVSLEAWKAILRQSRGLQVPYLNSAGKTISGSAATDSFAYPRTSIAGYPASDSSTAGEFGGMRSLTTAQTDELATQIVAEIKQRGPFLSLSEFVNRKLTTNTTETNVAIASTIQKALDNLAALGSNPKNPFASMQANSYNITNVPPGTTDYKFPAAAFGSSAFGVPGWVRQADILKPLAPILSARDDTFTIRGYGDSREKGSPSKIVARAWCEVVVQRQANYVDSVDSASIAPFSTQMTSNINKLFGRRYEVVSFRWLNENEI